MAKKTKKPAPIPEVAAPPAADVAPVNEPAASFEETNRVAELNVLGRLSGQELRDSLRQARREKRLKERGY